MNLRYVENIKRLLEEGSQWKIRLSLRRLRLKETSSKENHGEFGWILIVRIFRGANLPIK